jgi:hypothetical protein
MTKLNPMIIGYYFYDNWELSISRCLEKFWNIMFTSRDFMRGDYNVLLYDFW